jgi:1-acyl-sn-glycerol-3-phosphate acyltransferase
MNHPTKPSLLDDVREVARGWRWTRRPLTPRSAEQWVGSREPREFPTAWARGPLAKGTREVILRGVFKPLVWSQTEPHVEGLDHLEAVRRPVVFIANHASHMDTPLFLCSLPRDWRQRTAVAAAADYFFDIWWRAAATALAFNTFPIERTGGKRATDTARKLVAEGWNLLVFPEGTRSRDGWMGRFRHGAARLCVDQRIPAVPVVLRGTFAAMPRGRGWPRPGRFPLSVRFGPPLHPAEGEDFGPFSRRMQGALARLWDEDATGWWQSLQREAQGATPSLSGPPGPRWRRVWEASRRLPERAPRRVWSR